jgi:hypothetical protein
MDTGSDDGCNDGCGDGIEDGIEDACWFRHWFGGSLFGFDGHMDEDSEMAASWYGGSCVGLERGVAWFQETWYCLSKIDCCAVCGSGLRSPTSLPFVVIPSTSLKAATISSAQRF